MSVRRYLVKVPRTPSRCAAGDDDDTVTRYAPCVSVTTQLPHQARGNQPPTLSKRGSMRIEIVSARRARRTGPNCCCPVARAPASEAVDSGRLRRAAGNSRARCTAAEIDDTIAMERYRTHTARGRHQTPSPSKPARRDSGADPGQTLRLAALLHATSANRDYVVSKRAARVSYRHDAVPSAQGNRKRLAAFPYTRWGV